ncbi:AlkA N-terminal domain-containing protein [Dactylosporangium sp. AC04546]|uniref:DNA-3-methyladenine glycosylase family protein n=1 Tax=Dactylosporangium sp. AC04546 TaxID=2862460 RepID=UPI001EE0BE52|nr:AlkA N-terminal domain-containing protein [Dactylosporangium sp. AC04546]WVK78799.1 AlkA N-terminal domain-containing protein [Dactylosporangium sp. AC04546]
MVFADSPAEARMSTVRLDANGPFHHSVVFALLAAHAIPGVECLDHQAGSHTRMMALGGAQTHVVVRFDPAGVSVDLDRPVTSTDEAALRAWLDLGTDTRVIEKTLSKDPLLRPLVENRPGVRLVGYVGEFEAVAMTVIGQQVSLAAARTFGGRLAAAYGHPVHDLIAFPTPESVATAGPAQLQQVVGITRARSVTLHAVAERWAEGFSLAQLTVNEARRALLALPGVGPWTADYLTVRAMQHPDTFVPGDLVARRALGAVTVDEARTLAAAWAPWRSYALMHLWADAAYGAAKPGRT